jgi:L-aspartate oxidase
VAASDGSELELCSRDVVARRIFALRRAGERVGLDARNVAVGGFAERFPTVFAACMRFGIDPRREAIPIVPAAHYHMGGIAVDLAGRTSVRGLYACGEVAATGVHGANRLASNSLLESVVYPERIARDVASHAFRASAVGLPSLAYGPPVDGSPAEWAALRDVMYAGVGVERDETGLAHAIERLCAIGDATASDDVREAAVVGALVAHAALRRRETRGSHARSDHPEPSQAERHRSYSTLADARPALSA